MATDFQSGLPVRSYADGADERLHAKICDGATPSQMVTVDSNLQMHVKPYGTDSDAANVGMRLSQLGAVVVDGVYHASDNKDPSQVGIVAQERNAAAADSRQNLQPTAVRGATATTIVSLDVSMHDGSGEQFSSTNLFPVALYDASGNQIGTAANPVRVDPTGTTSQPVDDNGGTLTVDDGGLSLTVDSPQLPAALGQTTMANSSPVVIASDQSKIEVELFDDSGAAYTASNPLPVTLATSTSGTPIWDYNESLAVTKKTGTADVDWVASGASRISSIAVVASGLMKVIVQDFTAPSTYTTIWTDFNSTSNPKIYIPFIEDKDVASADGIRIKVYNLDEQDMDIYSTLEGELL